MSALLLVLQKIVGIAVNEGKAWKRWSLQFGMRLLRRVRALGVWVAAHAAARLALITAALAAFEAVTVFVSSRAITPLASNFIARCIPGGQAGDGLIWILWDSGLNGKSLFNAFVIYVANYTALWGVVSRWVRAQSIALSTYKANLRRADRVREASSI